VSGLAWLLPVAFRFTSSLRFGVELVRRLGIVPFAMEERSGLGWSWVGVSTSLEVIIELGWKWVGAPNFLGVELELGLG
jgi:hypothetical protein